MREKLIVIVGPTGVGKTKLSIMMAKRFGGEVVNGDASQVYRGLDIGTAKVTSDEADDVPHHLIDICDPKEDYTVADYQRDARRAIGEISHRGKLPILAGGTGFYIKAALYDYRFSSIGANQSYRREIETIVEREGAGALHAKLEAVDPESAARIHPHNVVRVMRALEVCHETGKPYSGQQAAVPGAPIFDVVFIGLTMDRELLYQRINQRVDQMMTDGLLDEVRILYNQGLCDSQALQAIGYKEFFPYFESRISLDQAVDQLKQNSRRYAKRQLTWFRGQMNVHWFNLTHSIRNFSPIAEDILLFAENALKK